MVNRLVLMSLIEMDEDRKFIVVVT